MLADGTVLQGRYKIIRPLGTGGMGAVYLALHIGLNQYVAVKANASDSPAAASQFETEVAILARLTHPTLPRVIDSFAEFASEGGATTRYLVMEHIAGENLQEIIQKRGPLSESAALALMGHVLDAVQYLHSKQIIHRDIKPQNIVITKQRRAVLVDFGIAKVHAPTFETLTGARAVGSPGYAPPEQYGSGSTDRRSDIYGLGATLYFALTGQAPPDAPARAAGVRLIPPSELNGAISPGTESAIVTALNLKASERFSSAREMHKALQAPQATIPLPRPRSTFASRTNAWLAIVPIVFVLLFVARLLSAPNAIESIPTRTFAATISVIPATQVAVIVEPLATASSSATLTSMPTRSSTPTLTPATPTPSATPSPTPTQGYLYPAPVLSGPANGASFGCNSAVMLEWVWQGKLKPDEHFDIRVLKEGSAEIHSLAWSEMPSYLLRCVRALAGRDSAYYPLGELSGKILWNVVVVRDLDGKFDAQLSAESDTRWIMAQH